MIQAVYIFNNQGKPRLIADYRNLDVQKSQQFLKETYNLIKVRKDNQCNFIEGSKLLGGSNTKIIYRHYATLYFVFVVDSSESELGILDLIQVLVESLDKCFENVCELDIVFKCDQVHYILDEIISGGMVLETKYGEVVYAFNEQAKLK